VPRSFSGEKGISIHKQTYKFTHKHTLCMYKSYTQTYTPTHQSRSCKDCLRKGRSRQSWWSIPCPHRAGPSGIWRECCRICPDWNSVEQGMELKITGINTYT